MIITTPIYFVRIEGDLKNIISELPDIIIATYEEHLNKTYAILKATNDNYTKEVTKYFYKLHEDLEKHKKKYKKEQVDVKYSREGIHFKVKHEL
jgi:hypothetical protein